MDLRSALPGVALIHVVHVCGDESAEYAVSAVAHVDALLLDSGKIDGEVNELGGTDGVHDWTLSRQIRDAVSIPLFLAGGLHASNVAATMAAVRPFGLDVCSGVRTNGVLDPEKIDAFFAAIDNWSVAHARHALTQLPIRNVS